MPTITGIEKVYFAKLLKDLADAISYAPPKYYKGIQEYDMKPKQNTEKQYSENKLSDQATAFDSADVDILISALESAQKSELLGQTIAAEGGVFAALEDQAPFVALLYKATIRGGYRYGVLYKGMFTLPDETIKGQEGKIEFQSPKISATFQPLDYVITKANGEKVHLWEWHVDTTDPNCPADIDDTWFTAVRFPTVDVTAPTATVTPADEATGVTAGANIVWTFDKALDSETVTKSNFMLLSGGMQIDGALSVDATGKIVTFDPTAALTSGTYVAVVTANVRSAAGVALKNSIISNFTV